MATRIKLRRDTTANWMDANPILANGEMGIEADTRRTKIGDGATAWNDLKYAFTDQLKIDGKTINTEMGVSIASQDPETWISSVRAKFNWAGTDGVVYDSMGNLYMSGWEEYGYDLNDGVGNGSSFLVKYDPKGEVLWTKYISDVEIYTEGGGVVVDSEDNVIQIASSWNDNFILVTKFTSEGAVVWQKRYTDVYDYARAYALAVDGNDNLVFAGERGDPEHDDYKGIFVTKIMGLNGDVVWSKTMGKWNTDAWQPSLAIDGANNVIFAGMDDYNDNGRTTITKLTVDGSFVWTKTLRNPEGDWNGYELDLGSLDADADGNIYFIGSYEVPDFVTDIQGNTEDGRAGLMLKMNSDGVVQWSRLLGPGDCNDLGAQVVYNNGKLYATVQTERKYYKNDFYTNEFNGYTTQEIVLFCLDADSGKPLWANNFGPEVLWGWSNPTGANWNTQDRSTYSGKLIAVHKDYVAVAGQAGEYSRVNDYDTRSYAFLAQLPADGSEMDLDSWKYKATKHKGVYGKIKTEDWNNNYDVNTTNDIVLAGSDEYAPVDTADNVVIRLLAAGANQWDFKPNGDLALPVGGNIEISRATTGDINVVGYFDSDNDNGIYNQFASVTTDADGNRYYVGTWNTNERSTPNGNSRLPMVVKVNAQGQVEWKTRLSNNWLYENNAVYGDARAVAYDPANNTIVVVCTDSGEGNDEQMLIVDLNTTNGDVIESHRYQGPDDIRANSITVNADGERFVAGSMQGSNYINFTLTNTMVVSTTTVNTLQVPLTVFDGHAAPNWRQGTNGWYIDGYGDLNSIDFYEGILGTVRGGSGATFDITADGTGGYTLVLGSLGINYRVDHQIKVLGSQLGGVDGVNDAIITVNVINSLETGDINSVSIGGTSTGSATYPGVAGTNWNTGTGFTINVQVDAYNTVSNLIVYHANGGQNYSQGDVITFPGTSLGGTSTATDIVITALQVGGFARDVQPGEDSGYAVTTRGISPLTEIRLKFSSGDYTTGGPFTLQHYTDANTFLAKFNPVGSTGTNLAWAKWIEKSNYDQGISVDYDSAGNIYWASNVYDEFEIDQGDWNNRPVITKLNSAGEVQWSKSYSLDGQEGYVIGMQVDSEDKVILAHNKYNTYDDNNNPVVQRIKPNGDVIWTQRWFIDGNEGNGEGGLALDSDDNIYFTTPRYDGEDWGMWTSKLDGNEGNIIWQQQLSHERQDLYHHWVDETNSLTVGNKHYHLALWTYDMDGNEGNALAVSLPADGSAKDIQAGPFSVTETYYNGEGGDGSQHDPVTRNYTVSTATNQFTLITDREDIRGWIEPGPTSYYPVYTNSDAGIVFGDGSVQTTSGQGIPQIRHNRYNKRITLKLSDAGRHLYITNDEMVITVPTYSEVPFPVGTVITIVNLCGDYVYIAAPQDNWRTDLYCPALDGSEGSSNDINGWRFEDNGGGNLITLLKVEESYSNGSRWIITGNNASNFTNY